MVAMVAVLDDNLIYDSADVVGLACLREMPSRLHMANSNLTNPARGSGSGGGNTALPLDTGSGSGGYAAPSIGSATGNAVNFNLGGGGSGVSSTLAALNSGIVTQGMAGYAAPLPSSMVVNTTGSNWMIPMPAAESNAQWAVSGWNSAYYKTPGGLVSEGLGAVGTALSNWGSSEASAGSASLGTLGMFAGGVFGAASSLTNPVAGILAIAGNSYTVGQEHGALAGIGYGLGSPIGLTQAAQAIAGENFLTGQALTGLNRWAMGVQALSAASGSAAALTGFGTSAAAETTAGRLNILNPEFTPYASEWLQNATDRAAAEIGANPESAQGVLSDLEYKAGTKTLGVAWMQFGNAVEGKVAQYWLDDPLARQMLEYTGNVGRIAHQIINHNGNHGHHYTTFRRFVCNR